MMINILSLNGLLVARMISLLISLPLCSHIFLMILTAMSSQVNRIQFPYDVGFSGNIMDKAKFLMDEAYPGNEVVKRICLILVCNSRKCFVWNNRWKSVHG